jgi:hypothetical protein
MDLCTSCLVCNCCTTTHTTARAAFRQVEAGNRLSTFWSRCSGASTHATGGDSNQTSQVGFSGGAAAVWVQVGPTAGRRAGVRASVQAGRRTEGREGGRQAGARAGRWTGRQADMQAGEQQAGGRAGRRAGRRTCRQAGRRACRRVRSCAEVEGGGQAKSMKHRAKWGLGFQSSAACGQPAVQLVAQPRARELWR